MTIAKKYGFLWVTLFLFLGSVAGHWTFAWQTFKQDRQAHGEPIIVKDYMQETLRDTLENWQSEFLQLIWQVLGLAILLHVGSPQSKEGDERKEEKLDEILRLLKPAQAEKVIQKLEVKYPKA
jgi:hypothetical protein